MSKNFGDLKKQLGGLATETPSIHSAGEPSPEPKVKAPSVDRSAQYLLKMSRDQRRQLVRLAALEDMTIRGFILDALKEKGLNVSDEDMIDLRRTVG